MSVAFRTYLLQTLTLPTNEPYPDLYQYGQDEALPPQNQAAPPAAPRAPQAAPTAPRRPVTANECRDHLFSLSQQRGDRKSTRLNSSHVSISYAVFCLKKKKQQNKTTTRDKT